MSNVPEPMTEPTGDELWKSDGTASSTVMVKDIWSGSPSILIPSDIHRIYTLFLSHTEPGIGICGRAMERLQVR